MWKKNNVIIKVDVGKIIKVELKFHFIVFHFPPHSFYSIKDDYII
jgi:hypothetical protein